MSHQADLQDNALMQQLGRAFHNKFPKTYSKLLRQFDQNIKVTLIRRQIQAKSVDTYRAMRGYGASSRLWYFLHPESTSVCLTCGSLEVRYNRFLRQPHDYCSVRCRNRNEKHKLYGEDNHATWEVTKVKVLNTFSFRYEGDHPLRDPHVRARKDQTCVKRYGFANHMQNAEAFERNLRARTARKTITINSMTHAVQGYEGMVLAAIEPKIAQISTSPKDMPTLLYRFNGKDSRYYADAKIKTKSGKKILLEVKSWFTLFDEFHRNLAKFARATRWCSRNGYSFVLAVRAKDGKITWFKNPTGSDLWIEYML